jgi:hypothetical protein
MSGHSTAGGQVQHLAQGLVDHIGENTASHGRGQICLQIAMLQNRDGQMSKYHDGLS